MTDQSTLARFSAAVETLPGKMTELRRLWLAAAEADERLSRCYVAAGYITNAEFDRLEDAQQDTRHALLDHLLMEHGLTTADIRRNPL